MPFAPLFWWADRFAPGGALMAKPLVPDDLWEVIRPLLPPPKPRRPDHPGRKPVEDRQALTGILFVLKTGIPWELLPQEMGCGCGMTCWRRLLDWQKTAVGVTSPLVLLACLLRDAKLGGSAAAVDGGGPAANFVEFVRGGWGGVEEDSFWL